MTENIFSKTIFDKIFYFYEFALHKGLVKEISRKIVKMYQ